MKIFIGLIAALVFVGGVIGVVRPQWFGVGNNAGTNEPPTSYGLTICQDGACAKITDVGLDCQSTPSTTQCAIVFSIQKK